MRVKLRNIIFEFKLSALVWVNLPSMIFAALFEILLRKSWSSQCQLKASKYIAKISWCSESFLKYYSERAEVANINWKLRNMLQELLDVVKVIWNMIESQPTLDKKKLEFLSEKRTSRDIWSTRGGVKISKKIRTSFLNPPLVFLIWKKGYQKMESRFSISISADMKKRV